MMSNAARFDYQKKLAGPGKAAQLPYLPITLQLRDRRFTFEALVDTGSVVNVLPYDVGLQLGADWEQQGGSFELTGNLSR